jgi:hypothetical protein
MGRRDRRRAVNKPDADDKDAFENTPYCCPAPSKNDCVYFAKV